MLMIQQLVGERVPETVWHLLVEAPKKLNTTWLISYIMGVLVIPHTRPQILYFIILAQKSRPDCVCTVYHK